MSRTDKHVMRACDHSYDLAYVCEHCHEVDFDRREDAPRTPKAQSMTDRERAKAIWNDRIGPTFQGFYTINRSGIIGEIERALAAVRADAAAHFASNLPAIEEAVRAEERERCTGIVRSEAHRLEKEGDEYDQLIVANLLSVAEELRRGDPQSFSEFTAEDDKPAKVGQDAVYVTLKGERVHFWRDEAERAVRELQEALGGDPKSFDLKAKFLALYATFVRQGWDTPEDCERSRELLVPMFAEIKNALDAPRRESPKLSCDSCDDPELGPRSPSEMVHCRGCYAVLEGQADALAAENVRLRKVVDAATSLVAAWCPDDSPEEQRLNDVVHELWASQDEVKP